MSLSPPELAVMLSEHLRLYPPAAVTLPWETPDGEPVTFSLMFTDGRGKAVNRNLFNRDAWKPALAAAGVIPPDGPASGRQPGMTGCMPCGTRRRRRG